MSPSLPSWQLWALGVPIFAHVMMAILMTRNRLCTQRLLPAPVGEPALSAATSLSLHPSVMVLIPARNEAANIEACVVAALQQRYPRLSVRVIDDHSTDGTGDIVAALGRREPRLSLMQAPDLPPGWLGKPHALHAGTRGVSADYLLFIDADLRLLPDAVARAVSTALARDIGLLTVVPRLLAESFWERAIQPVVALLLFSLLDPVRVMDPRSSFASANGPFMLFSRAAYERIGGHAAVAGEVVEDLELARLIKRAGLRLGYYHGTDVTLLRMYDSLPAILSGWGKNFHIALGKQRWLAPIGALLMLWVFCLPGLALLPVLLWGSGKLAVLAASCYGADWLARLALRADYGLTLRGSRVLGGAAVAYILCMSAYRAAAGKAVSWRGRSYGPKAPGHAKAG